MPSYRAFLSGVSSECVRLSYLQGKRGALPSSTIMLRQPMQRFQQMQASDIDIYRNELRKTKNEIVSVRPPACPIHTIYANCLYGPNYGK